MENFIVEKDKVIENITSMKKGSYEQMWLTTMYSLESYFKSLFKFGCCSSVTRDNLNVIKEMFRILKTERKLLNFILKNIDKFEVESVHDVVQMLDSLNDKTVAYYYDVIEEIEDAVDMGDELRGIRPGKNFPTLIQSDCYANEVKALALSKDAIKDFLGYEDEFWAYIKHMDRDGVKVPYEGAEALSYAIPFKDDNDIVIGMKMYITEIVDLPTALHAIKTYEKAYGIYKSMGKKYVNVDLSLELQEEFKTSFLPQLDVDYLLEKKPMY